MTILTAKVAKYGLDWFIDLANAAPVAAVKHGRPVVVVMAAEEFEPPQALEAPATVPAR
jgi:PHD/YefM family antitoxin component YafN of YafNO toxin-antitoxin module